MLNLRWQLVLVASSAGLLFGALTIFAAISGHEGLVALIVIVGIGKMMALCISDTPVRHAFVAGSLAGLLAVWTQAAFLPLYFENNPTYAELRIPLGLPARTYTVLVAPIGGLIAGSIAGLTAWAFAPVFRRLRGRPEGQ